MRRNLCGFRETRQTRRSLSAFGNPRTSPQRLPEETEQAGGGNLTLISRIGPDRDALDIVLGCGVNGGQWRRDQDGGPREVTARTGGRDFVTGPLSSDGRIVFPVHTHVAFFFFSGTIVPKRPREHRGREGKGCTNAASRISIASSTGKCSCCKISSTSSTSL